MNVACLLGLNSYLQGNIQELQGMIDSRRRGRQRLRWLDGTTESVVIKLGSKLLEMVKVREAWRAAVPGVAKSWT